MESHHRDWVAGSTKRHKSAALNAKATLEFVKANHGCTTEECQVALGFKTNFPMLQKHKLVVCTCKKTDRKITKRWWPTGFNPPNQK